MRAGTAALVQLHWFRTRARLLGRQARNTRRADEVLNEFRIEFQEASPDPGRIVLNATDEGRLIYERCGFVPVGEGITWWLHRGPRSGGA